MVRHIDPVVNREELGPALVGGNSSPPTPSSPAASVPSSTAGSQSRSRRTNASDSATVLRLERDEPISDYAVRVRRSLDDLVAWRLAELRRQGVRTTKVELTEMLLWELAVAEPDDLEHRLEVFREHAPR
jgi:hypothetical protein